MFDDESNKGDYAVAVRRQHYKPVNEQTDHLMSLTANRKLLKANPPLTSVTGDHQDVPTMNLERRAEDYLAGNRGFCHLKKGVKE
uniref:SFRICE_026277 n=1 Tax=Spodoptera frugiperda TaxID=7108 RepID=A0A2H1VEW7_SPOFR